MKQDSHWPCDMKQDSHWPCDMKQDSHWPCDMKQDSHWPCDMKQDSHWPCDMKQDSHWPCDMKQDSHWSCDMKQDSHWPCLHVSGLALLCLVFSWCEFDGPMSSTCIHNNNSGYTGNDGSGRLCSFHYFPLNWPLWKRQTEALLGA